MAHHSVGVSPVNMNDLTGQRFGRLVALNRDGTVGNGEACWSCKCDCGRTKRVKAYSLRTGLIRSCGCLRSEKTALRHLQHGDADSVEHIAWMAMIGRCENNRNTSFAEYGGRGIFVCNGWRQSYASFLADIGRRPTTGHSLDRIQVNGGYTCGHCDHCKANNHPANCRWATRTIQSRNRRISHFVSLDGISRTIAEWSEITGIKAPTIRRRLKSGWTPQKALTIKPL